MIHPVPPRDPQRDTDELSPVVVRERWMQLLALLVLVGVSALFILVVC